MEENIFAFIILSMFIVIFIAPIISLFIWLIFKKHFLIIWAFSSVGLVLFAFVVITIIVLADSHEDKVNEEDVDEVYEEMEAQLPEGDVVEKIFIQIKQVGKHTYLRRARGTLPRVDYNTKNYNDKDFKGTIIIYATYKGELVGKKEEDFEIDAGEYQSNSLEPKELDINAHDQDLWENVEFEHEIRGDFE